jgi:hypothetical protein
MSGVPLRHLLAALIAASSFLVAAAPRNADALPSAPEEIEAPSDAEQAAIEAQPVCIGSTVWSAGELGSTLFYRRARLPDGKVAVGYYAFFSEERPWGNNWLTWSVAPALAIDAVYTRFLFVAPGIQRARYGEGDVEGFRVIYAAGAHGRLVPESAVADDGWHRRADLTREELFAVDPARVTLATDSWSHHLGAHVARPSDLVWRRCYEKGRIKPIDREVIRRFRLDRRARPAAVDGEIAR